MSDSSMASTTLKAPAPQAKYQSEEESIASFSMGKEADYSHKIDSSPIKPMSLDFDSVDNGQMSAYQSEEEENEENTFTQVKYCVESSFKILWNYSELKDQTRNICFEKGKCRVQFFFALIPHGF